MLLLVCISPLCQDDLVAIGILAPVHRHIVLTSVKILKEQGAAWVYLLLASQEQEQGQQEKEVQGHLGEEVQGHLGEEVQGDEEDDGREF